MTEVLVVGAGPAGLALACALRQHDVDVRVVDAAAGPATSSRANILHARGVEVLSRLGALGDLPERSVRAIRITMHLNGKPLVRVSFGEIEGAQLSALLLSQARIEEALRARLAELGGAIEWGTTVGGPDGGPNGGALERGTALVQDETGVTVSVNGEPVRADWVVGCDGAHSAVRELAGIGFPGAPVTDEWLLADVRADWDFDRVGSGGWFHRDGLFFAMPMRAPDGPDNLWRFMADVRLADGETLTPDQIVERLTQFQRERVGGSGVRVNDLVWTSVFKIHRRLADSYRAGRVMLAGDSAHIHSPFGGQGMNTGIGDAENLAWKLALVVRGRADESLLDTYEAERRPLAEEVLSGTTSATKMLLADGMLVRFLRDRVIAPIGRLSVVQRQATKSASQLSVTYRGGPLAGASQGGGRFRRGPRAGDRIADRACRRTDGSTTRLHAELGGRWVLLAPNQAIASTLGYVAEKALGEYVVTLLDDAPMGGTSEAFLVRPDAHLAWRGKAGLARWIETTLSTKPVRETSR